MTLAGSGVAIAVKTGAPKPDIFTPKLLRKRCSKREIHREIVGFLPGDLNLVMTGSKKAETGKALIGSLRSPEAAALLRSKGLDPRQTVAAA